MNWLGRGSGWNGSIRPREQVIWMGYGPASIAGCLTAAPLGQTRRRSVWDWSLPCGHAGGREKRWRIKDGCPLFLLGGHSRSGRCSPSNMAASFSTRCRRASASSTESKPILPHERISNRPPDTAAQSSHGLSTLPPLEAPVLPLAKLLAGGWDTAAANKCGRRAHAGCEQVVGDRRAGQRRNLGDRQRQQIIG